MNNVQDDYLELAALIQCYLLQEYKKEEWIFAEFDTFHQFKQQAQQQQPQLAVAAPQAALPSARIQNSEYRMQNRESPETHPIQSPKKPPEIASKQEPKPEPLPPAEPPIAPPPPKKIAAKPEFFVPEPLPQAPAGDLTDIRKIVEEKFPHQRIVEEPPAAPQPKIAEVLILSIDESAEEREFLEKIAKAIRERFCSASVVHAAAIEQRSGWDAILSTPHVRLILSTNKILGALPHLMQYQRVLSKGSKHYLGKVPLCIMAEISHYLQDKGEKAALWKAICDALAKP